MKKSLVLSAFFLLSMAQARAQLDPSFVEFITARDSNSLGYYYNHHSLCPWSEDEAVNTIEGVIKRSRIKPTLGLGFPNEFYLNVGMICSDITFGAVVEGHSVHVQVMFGDYPMLYEKHYGGMLQVKAGDSGSALTKIKDMVERAITDFVEVNFLMDN